MSYIHTLFFIFKLKHFFEGCKRCWQPYSPEVCQRIKSCADKKYHFATTIHSMRPIFARAQRQRSELQKTKSVTKRRENIVADPLSLWWSASTSRAPYMSGI